LKKLFSVPRQRRCRRALVHSWGWEQSVGQTIKIGEKLMMRMGEIAEETYGQVHPTDYLAFLGRRSSQPVTIPRDLQTFSVPHYSDFCGTLNP
jgi:hypothetical protein